MKAPSGSVGVGEGLLLGRKEVEEFRSVGVEVLVWAAMSVQESILGVFMV